MTGYKTLAFAVGLGTVGYVLLEEDQPFDWGMSPKAYKSPKNARDFAKEIITLHQPEVVLTEALDKSCRKGDKAQANIAAITKLAEEFKLLNATVSKRQTYDNKYVEAQALADRFPHLGSWVPAKPPIWGSDSPRIILFEALSMALKVQQHNNKQ